MQKRNRVAGEAEAWEQRGEPAFRKAFLWERRKQRGGQEVDQRRWFPGDKRQGLARGMFGEPSCFGLGPQGSAPDEPEVGPLS